MFFGSFSKIDVTNRKKETRSGLRFSCEICPINFKRQFIFIKINFHKKNIVRKKAFGIKKNIFIKKHFDTKKHILIRRFFMLI